MAYTKSCRDLRFRLNTARAGAVPVSPVPVPSRFFLPSKFIVSAAEPAVATTPTTSAAAAATTNGGDVADSSCAKWAELCDRQASLAADHFLRSLVCADTATNSGSSLLLDGVTANQMLERYLATFGAKIRRQLEERKIDLNDNLLDHVLAPK
jgi:hypothetical protein